MSYLIDTNVISETRRRSPDQAVVSWLSERPSTLLYLSVLTLGEIRRGAEAITVVSRKQRILDWLETDLPRFFRGRILSIDCGVADRWGRLLAEANRPLPAVDSLIGATALHHGLSVVTRNEKDFTHPGLAVINPWKV